MYSIDLKSIMQRTVSSGLGDLVTRPTGRAVRDGIERALSERDAGQGAVIDFSAVRCLDISCADEIVGTLLRTYGQACYFLLRGVTDAHCDAISLVLERHGLTVVAEDREGRLQLLGPVRDTVRRAFRTLTEQGRGVAEVAARFSVSADRAGEVLDELLAHPLSEPEADEYRIFPA